MAWNVVCLAGSRFALCCAWQMSMESSWQSQKVRMQLKNPLNITVFSDLRPTTIKGELLLDLKRYRSRSMRLQAVWRYREWYLTSKTFSRPYLSPELAIHL